jgi:tRNA-dihydrouridine synthase B
VRLGAFVPSFFERNDLGRKRTVVRELYASADVLLSPMAGVTDLVFRSLCREMGADVTFCEFASADGILRGNPASEELLELGPDEHPVGIQLFGSEPAKMAAAAREAERLGPDIIDLNFGCPVKKVVKRNGGSALLCNLPLMEDIARAVVEATTVPVTAKTRLGWSEGQLNYLETTKMLQEAGACAITMHGRTREQRFGGVADWGPIAQMVEVAEVPVIGNGDVWCADDFLRLKQETDCDAVMVARGAIGNPFLFEEIRAAVDGEAYEPPTVARVVDVLLDHMEREIGLKGPRTGLNRMKKHFASYLKGSPGVSALRKMVFTSDDPDEARRFFLDYREEHAELRIVRAAKERVA